MDLMPPELTAQLVNPEDAALSAGSNKSVQWRCTDDPRHVWSAAPNTRRRSAGCPVCLNKVVLPGVNDLATTDPDLAAQLLDPACATQVHRGSHAKVDWTCLAEATHPSWEASVVSRARLGAGCPYCSGRRPVPGLNDLATTHPDLAATLVDPPLAAQLTAGSAKKVQWRCRTVPEHIWSSPVRNRIKSAAAECNVCQGRAASEPAALTSSTSPVARGPRSTATLAQAHPDIAAQLVDPSLGQTLSPASNRKVAWICSLGHTWQTKVSARTTGGTGCPFCSNHKVLAGFNDLATTHPDLAAQLLDPSQGTAILAGSGKKVWWCCPTDSRHQWQATPNNRTTARAGTASAGCPMCNGKRVVAGLNDLATERPDLAAQLADPQPDGTPAATLAATVRPGSNRVVTWACDQHAQPVTWETSPNNRRAGTRCPVCSERTVVAGINDLATTHPDLAAQIADPQPDGQPASDVALEVSRGSHRAVTWTCAKGHSWTTAVKDRVRGTDCPTCACAGTSKMESDLIDVVRRLVPDLVVVAGSLVNGRTGRQGGSPTLDVVVPERGVAVEFNGLYWHSEAAGKSRNYHLMKSELAAKAGLRLIHVWEDDWTMRRDIVIRALAHKLNATDRLLEVLPHADTRIAERVGARALTPDTATGTEAADFLDTHHIQGSVGATAHFVLRDASGAVRALLSVRSPRHNARMKRGSGQWEIQRYATFGQVRGGFSRLLAHAANSLRSEGVELSQWVSFSADDISDGGLYRSNGFVAQATLRPDYRYCGGKLGNVRIPKERFQRKRFREDPELVWDESWTERIAARENGLFRIYDAGKTRWVKDVA